MENNVRIFEDIATIKADIRNLVESNKQMCESNNKAHESIIKIIEQTERENKESMNNLTLHVNHEHELYSRQLEILRNECKSLREHNIATKNKYKGRMELVKWVAAIAGLIISSISIYTFLCTIKIF